MHNAHDADSLTPARLRSVAAVADSGSFSEAALQLGTSQSNVSRAVAAVEAALGATIFDRSTRAVRLTDAGRDFVERIAVIGAELDAAVRAIRPPETITPRLVVAMLTSVSEVHLADAIGVLGSDVVRFRCIEGLQATVEQAVASGRASLGVGDLSAVDSQLRTRPLWSEPFRIAVPARHRIARRRSATLADVAAEPLVGFSLDAELRSTVDRELAAARQLRSPDYIVDRYGTALSIVAAGMGVMVVPAIAAAAAPPGVRLVDLDHPGLRRTMGVITPAVGQVPVAASGLVDRLAELALRTAGVERA